ncbi:MAG: hypothetical protein FWG55_02100 [Candidatus Bathyarchaeota archaeon]|nr:hypothetical protein [Candidatus Termiticorpusculum sp.]
MSKKISFAILMIIVLVVSSVGAFYFLRSPQETIASTVTAGVKAGDVFTYQLTGFVESYTDFSIPENFVDINQTKYYRVEITKVDVPIVSYTVSWQFNNGTNFSYDGMINLENGLCSGHYWDIYAADLLEGSLSRPNSSEEPIISETQLKPYPNGDREINFLRSEYELYNPADLTYTEMCYVYNYVYFDKQTGMMVEYKSMEIYNSPEIMLTVEYKLVSSNIIC